MAHPALLPATRAWVASVCGGEVLRARRLVGGITSAMHLLTIRGREPVVLRRWIANEWGDGASVVADEARALTALADADVPTPTLLGTTLDPLPSVLMSRVPGRMDLDPEDPARWVDQLAATLVRIHALPADVRRHEPRGPEPRPKPAWCRSAATWREAMTVLAEPPPPLDDCFVHGDYQHFNVLWQRGRLTGVVDWTWPCRSAPEVDTSHCRRNLAILFSPERAEAFRRAYERESGRTLHPWYDVHRLTSFDESWQGFIPIQVGGRIPVDTAGMPARVEALLDAALRRL